MNVHDMFDMKNRSILAMQDSAPWSWLCAAPCPAHVKSAGTRARALGGVGTRREGGGGRVL